MTDQHTKDFFAALPQDKPTTWSWDDAPATKCLSKVIGYFPICLKHQVLIADDRGWNDTVRIDDVSLTPPAPKTLKGLLYQGWSIYKSGEMFFYEECRHKKPFADDIIEDSEAYGYRTLDPETGQYGPLVIVGGGDE